MDKHAGIFDAIKERFSESAQPVLAATGGDDVSYANLFNPLSPLMGGGDKYPEFMARLFPDNPRAAWLVSKVGAVGLLAAAIAGAVRGGRHIAQMSRIKDKDNPASSLSPQLGMTFTGNLSGNGGKPSRSDMGRPQEKRAADESALQSVPLPDATDLKGNFTNVGVPLLSALVALMGAWKGSDYVAGKIRNRKLDKAIAGKRATLKNLIQTRARIAKGTISDEEVARALAEVSDADNYIKNAAEDPHPYIRGGLTGAGLLLAALGIISGAGAYKYFTAGNIDNIRYRAMEKGLKEYAKQKTLRTPVTTIPDDAEEYFRSIDEGAGGRSVRETPESSASRKPISVTL